MTRLSHAGIGFPNGPVENATVFALPSPDILMLSTEGRWHHDAAVAAGKRVLWRAIPRIGKRPAELGWSPSRFVAETINLTDAPAQPIRDFIPWNELDLRDERGDREDDYASLDNRYVLIGGWASSVVEMLRQWSPSTRIHWPAWTPDHEALDHLRLWKDAANLCHVVDFHAYDSLANIERQYTAYRQAFPDKPLALTEWHCKGDIEEERRVLRWLAETMRTDPLFETACFFIWRWHNAPGWWDDAWDIEHSADRLALFADPPVATTIPEPISVPDYHAMTRGAARAAGIDEDLFERQIGQESGWAADVIECRRASSAGAEGIAQIIRRFHPGVDPCNPPAALDYAARLMASNVALYGSYRKALIAYNWGPGNLAGWNGQANTLPAETRHYLDVILGPGWPEPGGAPMPEIRLSDVLARARSRTGDPYVWDGEQPGGFDCSGFIKWAYNGTLTSFTDAILGETERVESPAPGDIVLYEYSDSSQPGVRFPHVGLFLSDTRTLDARFGMGVGEHDQLPRSTARRYYRRKPGVVVDTLDAPAPPPPAPPATDELAALRAENERLRTVLGYSTGDVAAALKKEADAIRGSLGALDAAIETLARQR